MTAHEGRQKPPGGGLLLSDQEAGNQCTPESLPPEAHQMADAAGDFLRREVLPAADRLEAHEPGLMAALLKRAGDLGLLGLGVSTDLGGLALGPATVLHILEALSPEPSFAVSHNVHTGVATLPLLWFGGAQRRTRLLPRMASGELLGAFALTEAHSGSDAFACRTRAVPSRGGAAYTLTGEKMWTTNAAFADVFTVFAMVDDAGLSAFVVERTAPGLTVGREEQKLGLKGSSTCRVTLDRVRVDADGLLGTPGAGPQIALGALNLGRLKIATTALGQSKHLLGLAARYARERHAFGHPIGEFGLVQTKIATMAARILAAESALYRVAGKLESGDDDQPQAASDVAVECALLKVACTEVLGYCADECLQIHGANGYSEEFPVARAWRDARVFRIFEGTNEVNRLAAVNLVLRRAGRGHVTLAAPAEGAGSERADASLRRPLVRCLEVVRTCTPEPAAEQIARGALADLMIATLMAESALLRADAMARLGAAHSAQAALAAALAEDDALALARAAVRTALSVCGSAGSAAWSTAEAALDGPPIGASLVAPPLAEAVLEAGGYIW